MSKFFKATFVFLCFFIFLISFNIVFAIDPEPPHIQVEIGGFRGWGESGGWTQSGTNIEITWISDYVAVIYQYGVGLAAVLATVMIMVGGFLWLTAGGSPQRVGKAKEFITSSFTGLLLALFSFMILQTINPQLVKRGGLVITMPEEERIETPPGVDLSLTTGDRATEDNFIWILRNMAIAGEPRDELIVDFGNNPTGFDHDVTFTADGSGGWNATWPGMSMAQQQDIGRFVDLMSRSDYGSFSWDRPDNINDIFSQGIHLIPR